tara:strand:- start:1181 stop:2683 length:1503 start_codon:yes stop_codon:yes gene_type:complete
MGQTNLGKVAELIVKNYESDTITSKQIENAKKAGVKSPGKQQRGRAEFTRKRGQILVVTFRDFAKGLLQYERYNYGNERVSSPSERKQLWNQAKIRIETSLPPFTAEDEDAKREVLATIKRIRDGNFKGVKTGKIAQLKRIKPFDLIIGLTNYSAASGLKKKTGKANLDTLLEDFYEQKELKRKDDVKYKKAGTFWQVGHGQFGVSTSQVDIRRSKERAMNTDAGKALTPEEVQLLDNLVEQLEGKAEVKIDHKMIVKDDGTYINEFIPIVSLEVQTENQGAQSALEGMLASETVEKIQRLALDVDAEGSPSQRQAYENALRLYFSNRFKGNKNVILNFKGKNTNLNVRGSKKRGKVKRKERLTPIAILGSGALLNNSIKRITAKNRYKKKNLETKRAVDPGVLLGQLNKDLGQQVERNMGRPALRSDSGRFANSAQVLAVIPTRVGLNQIDYTYQKDPYQVFEGGFGYPSAFDPRQVIEKSIRELATRQLETKFVLRRI